jgi:hypothetical protein
MAPDRNLAGTTMRRLSIFLCLIGSMVLALPAQAERFRFPPTGKYAFRIDLPRGWTTKTDKLGGMLLIPPNQYAVVYLSIIVDDKLRNQPNSVVAAKQAKIVGIESIDSHEPARISDGRTIFRGTAYYGKMPEKRGFARKAKIVIIKLTPNTWAQVWTVTQPGMNPVEANALDNALNAITLITAKK